ncbi:hypothetical protein FF38_03443 [Lucilia cuprina]|uniref:Torsin-1A-interacting protein 2 n=1 Tax=Lucilia cuprina TaxID=7375 RepID=A0A0L0C674_LUCCU|nr:hypothetical protein CVS40_10791 [Lucilia cuprina]KNC27878.1 hypothetical protein FF38_03443 [Lucilia cuprina]
MAENIPKARPSIHDRRDSQTPQREEFINEGNDSSQSILQSSQEQITTESGGSDLEGFEDEIIYNSKGYKLRPDFNVSRSVPRTPQRPKPKPVVSSPKSPQYANEKATMPLPQVQHSLSPFHILLISFTLLLASWYFVPREIKPRNCSFDALQEKYNQENPHIWRTLSVGIETILNRRTEQPAVYLFAHYGGPNVFRLIKDIARHSSGCFGKQMLPIEMEGNDFISAPGVDDDYGFAIQKYKAKIKEGNVILIANLNEIPAEAARALHTICDTHSPIAKDVVIFLTLTLSVEAEGSATAKAEYTLEEMWGSKLIRSELDPLITRVTDQVVVLQS